MTRWWWVTLLGGCSFSPSALDFQMTGDAAVTVPDGGGTPDAPPGIDGAPTPPDAPPGPDAPPADCEWEFTPTNFDPCQLPPSNGDAVEGVPATFDTDTGITTLGNGATVTPISALLPQSGGPSIRVLVFDTFFIDQPIRAVGSHPLLIVGLDSIEVGGDFGLVDVSAMARADGTAEAGPGGDDATACASGRGGNGGAPPSETLGGSGGGGGSFGSRGGPGGEAGDSDGGDEGETGGSSSLSPLRGGCRGGTGGSGRGPGPSGGVAGAGGGALQISARREVILSGGGQLRAGGGGGRAPLGLSGGGGGGSGGAILLEAARVTISSGDLFTVRVCANGGSGGEGGGLGVSRDGAPGTCADDAGAETPNGSTGGNGGRGGYRDETTGGEGGEGGAAGAGGGGGGVGRIRIRAIENDPILAGAVVSPAPVLD